MWRRRCDWSNMSKVTGWGFSLDNAPQSGRPVEVDSNQIKTLTENYQHPTIQEITDILKISQPMKLLVRMKNASFVLWKKTQTFWPTQYAHEWSGLAVSTPLQNLLCGKPGFPGTGRLSDGFRETDLHVEWSKAQVSTQPYSVLSPFLGELHIVFRGIFLLRWSLEKNQFSF